MKGKETNGLLDEIPTIDDIAKDIPTVDDLIKDMGLIDIGDIDLSNLPAFDFSVLDALEIPDLEMDIPDMDLAVPAFDFNIDDI